MSLSRSWYLNNYLLDQYDDWRASHPRSPELSEDPFAPIWRIPPVARAGRLLRQGRGPQDRLRVLDVDIQPNPYREPAVFTLIALALFDAEPYYPMPPGYRWLGWVGYFCYALRQDPPPGARRWDYGEVIQCYNGETQWRSYCTQEDWPARMPARILAAVDAIEVFLSPEFTPEHIVGVVLERQGQAA